jgi:hypothetical protein
MEIDKIAAGLWRWSGPHPEWTADSEWERDVGSVYYETNDVVCLVDPLVPADGALLWDVLDPAIERAGKPVAVLLTVPWHRRSADVLATRYGSERDGWELSLRSREPPLGVDAVEICATDERMFWFAAHRTLVAGDVLIGSPDGIAVCPRSWVTHATTYPPDFLASLQRLLELPVEIVLLSHGAPVFSGGHALLHRAVDAVAG